jgi:hypothetical protein
MMPVVLLASEVQCLSTGGWIMMVLCVGLVVGILVFCLRHVLKQPPTADVGGSDEPPALDFDEEPHVSYHSVACSACGKLNKTTATYCAHCGERMG